jgi:ubiquinone/menaquinone biosynthesis C-methylase UbiE
LAALCHINKDKHILEVGCSTGVTTSYLDKRFGCRVTGMDLTEKMVEWARKRAQRKSIEHQEQFMEGDAQVLPFEDNHFDAVICESVTAFPADIQRMVNENARVTRTGGYMGMNEGTWIRTSPPFELIEYIKRTMAGAKFLPAEGWKELLENSNLTDIIVTTYQINAFSQRFNEMRGLDSQDRLDCIQGVESFFMLYLKNPTFRKYARRSPLKGRSSRTCSHIWDRIFLLEGKNRIDKENNGQERYQA